MTGKLTTRLTLDLDGLTIHKHRSLPPFEGYVTGTCLFLDERGYDRVMRGDDIEVALADYKFHFLPAMGSGITWRVDKWQ